jgi:predicted MFS family arabinose efflux permease
MVTAVTALLMGVSVYGPEDGWGSTKTLSTLGLSVILTIWFLMQEKRATEPILPLPLFKNHTFSITSLLGFVIGAGMFGAIIMIPLYLQLVKGDSATNAGLKLIPFMLGIVIMSMYSGKQISKKGHYRIYPIVGLVVMTIGLALLTRLTPQTSFTELGIYEFMIGAGLGLSMQPVVIALQNDIDFKDMGIATSANSFFRSVGSTIGVALFGAIYANSLAKHIPDKVAELGATNPAALAGATPEAFEALKNNSAVLETFTPDLKASILDAFTNSFQDVFMSALPVTALGIVFALMVREKPLRSGAEFAAAKEEAAGEAMA